MVIPFLKKGGEVASAVRREQRFFSSGECASWVQNLRGKSACNLRLVNTGRSRRLVLKVRREGGAYAPDGPKRKRSKTGPCCVRGASSRRSGQDLRSEKRISPRRGRRSRLEGGRKSSRRVGSVGRGEKRRSSRRKKRRGETQGRGEAFIGGEEGGSNFHC